MIYRLNFTAINNFHPPLANVYGSLREGVQIIEEDFNNQMRWIREAIWIRKGGGGKVLKAMKEFTLVSSAATTKQRTLHFKDGKNHTSYRIEVAGSVHH